MLLCVENNQPICERGDTTKRPIVKGYCGRLTLLPRSYIGEVRGGLFRIECADDDMRAFEIYWQKFMDDFGLLNILRATTFGVSGDGNTCLAISLICLLSAYSKTNNIKGNFGVWDETALSNQEAMIKQWRNRVWMIRRCGNNID